MQIDRSDSPSLDEPTDLQLVEMSRLTRSPAETKALHDGLELVSVDAWKKDHPQQPKRGTLPVRDRLTPEELDALKKDGRETMAEMRRQLGRA